MKEITAEAIAQAFLMGWISRFGTPLKIITDQSRQFESSLFAAIASLLGVQRQRTTAYHPQSNGKIEQWHRLLKTALKAQLS